jgi:sulfur relay (sulfurtransferase) DsrF/TusC family protein
MIFSKQYYHLQELKKAGGVPQFGSFKYTAAKLHEKGVLISIEEHTPKQFGLINISISSSEVGIFDTEVSLIGGKSLLKETLRLEDLLQYQYDKVDHIMLFDIAKVNVNLLIFLINKK